MRSYSDIVTRLSSAACMIALALLGSSPAALAQEAEKLSSDQFFAAKIHGDSYNVSVGNAPYIAKSMRVTGPRGYVAESKSLTISSSEPLADGVYNYEITGALPWNDAVYDAKSNRANGRSETARPGPAYGVIATGHFRIVNGTVFDPGNATEEKTSSPQQVERPERSDLR